MSGGPSDDLARRRHLAALTRERVVAGVTEVLGDRLALRPGERHAGRDDLVRVGPFDLLARCPRRLAVPADDYEDRIDTVRRRIGLIVLRRRAEAGAVTGRGAADTDLAADVQDALLDPAGWPPRLREWFESLDRAGRVAVGAAVHTWCADVLRLVGGSERIVWSDPQLSSRWYVPERAVQLAGPTDAVLGGPVSGQKLLVISDAVPGPGDRVRAGMVAVVHALVSGRTPVRVSIGSPAAGTVRRVEVDRGLVEMVTDRIVESVHHIAAGDRAPAVPGRWCAHCHLRDACPDAVR